MLAYEKLFSNMNIFLNILTSYDISRILTRLRSAHTEKCLEISKMSKIFGDAWVTRTQKIVSKTDDALKTRVHFPYVLVNHCDSRECWAATMLRTKSAELPEKQSTKDADHWRCLSLKLLSSQRCSASKDARPDIEPQGSWIVDTEMTKNAEHQICLAPTMLNIKMLSTQRCWASKKLDQILNLNEAGS